MALDSELSLIEGRLHCTPGTCIRTRDSRRSTLRALPMSNTGGINSSRCASEKSPRTKSKLQRGWAVAPAEGSRGSLRRAPFYENERFWACASPTPGRRKHMQSLSMCRKGNGLSAIPTKASGFNTLSMLMVSALGPKGWIWAYGDRCWTAAVRQGPYLRRRLT